MFVAGCGGLAQVQQAIRRSTQEMLEALRRAEREDFRRVIA
jgi:hypothetical protein